VTSLLALSAECATEAVADVDASRASIDPVDEETECYYSED